MLIKKLRKTGYHVVIVFSNLPSPSLEKQYRKNGAEVYEVNFNHHVSFLYNIFMLIKEKRPKFIHLHFFHPIELMPIVLFLKAKIIVTQHSSPYIDLHDERTYKLYIRKKIVYLSLLIFTKLFDNCIIRYIAVSNFIKKELINICKIKPEKITVLYNGINLCRFNPNIDGSEISRELKIDPKNNIITTVSWLIQQKGIEYLLMAFTQVLSEIPETYLLIVGEGSFKKELQKMSKKLRIQKNVIFMGIRNDVEKILAISDIVVLPSLLEEAFSYIALETMATARPIIATKAGGMPEALDDVGILVPRGNIPALVNSMLSLLKNKTLSTNLSILGRRRAERHFSINNRIMKEIKILHYLERI
jgi:glycosyltransferase involved in cell wall biosynthesis